MMGSKVHKNFEVYPVMLTPFQKNNKIDFEALRQLVEFYITTGSTGLFANCLSSEMFQLTDAERIQVTRTVVEQVDGRQKVVATGTFGYDLNKNIEFIKKIFDTGVHAVILNTSQLATQAEPDEVLKKNIDKILTETGTMTFGVYECPEPYKRLMSVEMSKWLGESGRFAFLKDTSCDLTQIKRKLEAVRGTSLQIYNANIPTGLSSILSGAKGLASIASNFYPEILHFLSKNHDPENHNLNKLNAFLIANDSMIHEFYPMSAKYCLKKRGMKINTNTRVHTGKFTVRDSLNFDTLFRSFETLASEMELEVYRF